MSLTAELAAQVLPQATLVRDLGTIQSNIGGPLQILDCERLLHQEQGDALPHGWHVTSDSIAARVARTLNARELVLLKSTLPTASGALERPGASTTQQELVDEYFGVAARGLPVRIVNLRDANFAELTL